MARLSRRIYVVGLVLLLLLFVDLLSPTVAAAPSGGSTITTSPISADLSATPGSTTTTTLQVQNNGTTAIGINVILKQFRAAGEDGQAQIINPAPGDPSISWVHFSQTTFVAQPGIWNNVVMTIHLPKTAAFGYYYAVLFAPNPVINGVVGDTNTVKGANAILILLDAHAPGEKEQLQVQHFQADKSSYQYLPATFSVTVHNSGNIFTAPEGDIYISRTPTGSVIDTLDINPGQGNVLPGTNRVFQAQWTSGFPEYHLKRVNGQIVSNKQGKPIQQLTWNFSNISKFRFGKYYAHLVLVYNNGSRDIPINSEISFWVIPWALLGGLLVFVVLVGAGLWTLLRSIIKRLRTVGKSR